MLRRLLLIVVLLVVLAGLYVAGAWSGLYGRHEGAGEPVAARIPESVVTERESVQRSEAAALTIVPPPKQVLFGDLHVHTTFSTDAFLGSLPVLQGEGAHPLCRRLRLRALLLGARLLVDQRPRRGEHAAALGETKESIRQCNAVAGDPDEPGRGRVPRLGVEPGRGARPRSTTATRTWCCATPRTTTSRPPDRRARDSPPTRSATLGSRSARCLPLLDCVQPPALLELPRPSSTRSPRYRAAPTTCRRASSRPTATSPPPRRRLFQKLAECGTRRRS